MTDFDSVPSGRPLNILQVAGSFTNWGGIELHLLNLGVQLRRRGHRVWVSAQRGRWVQQKALSLDLPVLEVSGRSQQDWSDFRRYYDLFRRERVDVVHTHGNRDMLVPAVAARLAGVPVVVTTWHLPKPFHTPRGGRIIMSLYNRMIAVSNSVRDMHLRHGVAPDKVQVIHHGTDVAAFQAVTHVRETSRASLGIPPDRIAVGIVGRVSPEKGHRYLLEAARTLGERFPLHYVVVGDGPDEGAVREHARALGLADRVSFAGFRDDVNNAINALDIVAVPSIWNEPCAAAVQQAMVLSRPVIGTAVGGTPEMVVEGETGLLVPPEDAGALADAIACLTDASLRTKMGIAGRARAEAAFSLAVMTDRVEGLYYAERERGLARRVLPPGRRAAGRVTQ